jgi:hypothetical protein
MSTATSRRIERQVAKLAKDFTANTTASKLSHDQFRRRLGDAYTEIENDIRDIDKLAQLVYLAARSDCENASRHPLAVMAAEMLNEATARLVDRYTAQWDEAKAATDGESDDQK